MYITELKNYVQKFIFRCFTQDLSWYDWFHRRLKLLTDNVFVLDIKVHEVPHRPVMEAAIFKCTVHFPFPVLLPVFFVRWLLSILMGNWKCSGGNYNYSEWATWYLCIEFLLPRCQRGRNIILFWKKTTKVKNTLFPNRVGRTKGKRKNKEHVCYKCSVSTSTYPHIHVYRAIEFLCPGVVGVGGGMRDVSQMSYLLGTGRDVSTVVFVTKARWIPRGRKPNIDNRKYHPAKRTKQPPNYWNKHIQNRSPGDCLAKLPQVERKIQGVRLVMRNNETIRVTPSNYLFV